jgi:hypothetical protein
VTHLSSTVLTHHDDNLGVREVAGVNLEVEVAESLLHRRVAERPGLLNNILLSAFGNTEGQALLTEAQVLGGDVAVQEDVDAFANGVRKGDDTVNSRLAVKHTDVVREVVQDGQIVLDDNDIVVGAQE